MASYASTATRPDRAKAIFGVVAVHAALAFVILSGLSAPVIRQAVEQLTMISIAQPPPLPPIQPPPKPAPQPRAMKKPEGAAAKKAEPSPIVAPQPKLPVPSPIPAAKVAGTGNAPNSGAALAGSGTGAGGSGNGTGGGGYGDYSRPVLQISTIPNREYRRLAAVSGMTSGAVGVMLRVNSDGMPSNCRAVRSSGSVNADALMCQLIVQYLRFRPAFDSNGRPVAKDISWSPRWWRP